MLYKSIDPNCQVISLVKVYQKHNKLVEIRLETNSDSRVLTNQLYYLDAREDNLPSTGFFISEQFVIYNLKVLEIKEYFIAEGLPKHLQYNLGWYANVASAYTVNILIPVTEK